MTGHYRKLSASLHQKRIEAYETRNQLYCTYYNKEPPQKIALVVLTAPKIQPR